MDVAKQESESSTGLGSDPPLQPPDLVLQCLYVLRFLQPALSPALQQQRSPLGCLAPGAQRWGCTNPQLAPRWRGEAGKRSRRHPEPRPSAGGFPNPALKATQGGWEVPLYRCNLLKQSNPYFLLVLERNSPCRCFRIHCLYFCVLQSFSGQTDRYSFGRVMPPMRSWADVIENCHPRFGGVSFFPKSFFHACTPQMEEGNEHSQTFGTASLLWLKVENIGCQIFYCSVN